MGRNSPSNFTFKGFFRWNQCMSLKTILKRQNEKSKAKDLRFELVPYHIYLS